MEPSGLGPWVVLFCWGDGPRCGGGQRRGATLPMHVSSNHHGLFPPAAEEMRVREPEHLATGGLTSRLGPQPLCVPLYRVFTQEGQRASWGQQVCLANGFQPRASSLWIQPDVQPCHHVTQSTDWVGLFI